MIYTFEINANLIAGILDHNFRARPAYAAGLEITQLLIVGLLGVLISWLSPLWALLLTWAVGGMLLGINAYLWQVQALVVPLATPLVLLMILYVLLTSLGVTQLGVMSKVG